MVGPAAVAASAAWAFSQTSPLETHFELRRECKRRGISVDHHVLRELWRTGRVAPFIEVRSRRSATAAGPTDPDELYDTEPLAGGTAHSMVRYARNNHRLVDPAELGYRPQVRFDPPNRSAAPNWRNGLIYSYWQLLTLWEAQRTIASVCTPARSGTVRAEPVPEWESERWMQARRQAVLLTAIEARYLPVVLPETGRLRNAEWRDWYRFRDLFDPGEAIRNVGWDPGELDAVASNLLHRADRTQPLSGPLDRLLRRLPQSRWGDLTGAPLASLDYRVAAEMVVLLIDDIERGQSPAPAAVHRSVPEHLRLSSRSDTLDNELSSLGISPHPKVVVLVEGETEEYIAPRVRNLLGIPDTLQAMRILNLRGYDRDLTKVGALAAAPLVDGVTKEGHLRLARPPSHLVVLLDPDARVSTPELVEEARTKIVNELDDVVRAQGHRADYEALSSLVEIHTWSHGTFEFTHFTDDQITGAICDLRPKADATTIRRAVAKLRSDGAKLDKTISRGRLAVSKVELAERLWPALAAQISQALDDPIAPMPEIASRLRDAANAGNRLAWGIWHLPPDRGRD